MAVDSNIGALPAAESIEDDSLLVAEQQGEAKHITGKMLKDYTKEGVQQFSSEAQSAAKDAQQAKKDAELARDQAQAIAGVDFLERPVYDPQNRKQDIFAYVDGKDFIGRSGEGENAEIFNNPDNVASGNGSHSEGNYTKAKGKYSHAEGERTTASGDSSHAEGEGTTASGYCSHAEGYFAESSGSQSHAEGFFTSAAGSQQHAQGRYNKIDTEGKYAHIVGNGTGLSGAKRSNAHTLDWAGLGWFAGGLKVGGTGQDDEEAKDVVAVPPVTAEDNGKVPRVVDGAWRAVDGGITIKKIVFTDRPSLWAWMLENGSKVQSVELTQQGMTAGMFDVRFVYSGTSIISISLSAVFSLFATGGLSLVINTVSVSSSSTMVSLDRKILVDAEGITIQSFPSASELSDEYWAALGTQVTVYYYSE